ncbi:MAG: hypothetical protein JWQ04_784 [Pedosphaera sp.]|nr:hypothetical protein [Pedosphaera sp.]
MLLKFKPRHFTLCLGIALAIKTSRGFAEEDYGSYRHEFYREDDHRMSIDTDSAAFDLGIGSHVRLNGEFVLDAISGATPTGAPPQSQWPFPTFTDLFNHANTQLFQAVVNDPNNLILYQSGYFTTFKDYTNYIAANNPQIPGQASNNAASAYHTLISNPLMHNSTQVPLTDLHDLRRAFSLGAPITFGIHQFTPQVSVSEESDYHSYGFALNYAAQLNKKNTTLNLGWSHDADRVRDDHLIWEGKVSDDILLGINQLLTPKSYFTVNFTYGQEYGYLSDPYRGVLQIVPNNFDYLQLDPTDAALIPEKRPRRRTKEIFYISYDQFVDPLNGGVELGYRFFHDSYGIFAHTFETAWHQKIGRNVVFTPAIRYYCQTAASFYSTYIVTPDPAILPAAYSADYRLSELQTLTLSATVTCRVQKHFSIDASYMRYIMEGLDGVTSPSAYPSANVYTIGARIWF